MSEEIVEQGFYGAEATVKSLEIGQLIYIDGSEETYYLGNLIAFSEDKRKANIKLLAPDGEESEEIETDTSLLKEPMYYELTSADLKELEEPMEEASLEKDDTYGLSEEGEQEEVTK